MPGLLQTADYAREIFRNMPIELDPDEVERLLKSVWPGRRSWPAMTGHDYGL